MFFSKKYYFIPLFLWRKEKKLFTLFFFGAKKRGKRNIHLPPSPPYMEGLNRSYSSLVQ